MSFELKFQPEARKALKRLRSGKGDAKKLRKVEKALAILKENPRHPGLRSHQMKIGPKRSGPWISYVENHTPGAWRIYWSYGSSEGEIQVISVEYIGPHE